LLCNRLPGIGRREAEQFVALCGLFTLNRKLAKRDNHLSGQGCAKIDGIIAVVNSVSLVDGYEPPQPLVLRIVIESTRPVTTALGRPDAAVRGRGGWCDASVSHRKPRHNAPCHSLMI
jgi:hypothetical protein